MEGPIFYIFCDDIILISSSEYGIDSILCRIFSYFHALGLVMSRGKSQRAEKASYLNIYIIKALRAGSFGAKGFLIAVRRGSLLYTNDANFIPMLASRIKLPNKSSSTVLELKIHRKLTTVAAILCADRMPTMTPTCSSMATVAYSYYRQRQLVNAPEPI